VRRWISVLFFVAVPAWPFHITPPAGARIGVLRMSSDSSLSRTIQHGLRNNLRELGFDAFDAQSTFEELSPADRADADFYVAVVSSQALDHPVAGGEIGDGRIGVDVAVVVSKIAAAVRLYDARTLEVIDEYDLQRNRAAVVPTAIGFGRFFWARIPLPFVQYAQFRSAAHAVARDAARRIAGQ